MSQSANLPPPVIFGDRDALTARIESIDPTQYDRTRNYLDGAVTWLSPYITHGIIDTVDVAETVLQHHHAKRCYRLLYELAWREYFHRTWQRSSSAIFTDLNNPQEDVRATQLPAAVVDASTGINVIDHELNQLFETGLMHNHTRMWLAGVVCNQAMTHWREPARWLHYHLLDGDLASNTLSWQWIAGTFSHKRYIANQDNLNKYSKTRQKNTWLDMPYDELQNLKEPEALAARTDWTSSLDTSIPDWMKAEPVSPLTDDIAIHSLWNLDAQWQTQTADHCLFIDTDLLQAWPMSEKRWRFIQAWLPEGTRVVTGTATALSDAIGETTAWVREYPACKLWGRDNPNAQTVSRRWLYEAPESSWSSFSQFWKQVRRQVGL